MAEASVPYVMAYGNITKALDRVKEAQTPPRFTQDFLATKLNLKGGGARPIIPFMKRTGFLGSDGTPTELYKRFRGTAVQSGAAAAEALRTGYARLYEVNEYVHDAKDEDLKGIVVQVTGMEPGSSTVTAILGSFKALRAYADFDASAAEEETPVDELKLGPKEREPGGTAGTIKLGYTINLNLPATSDVAVFNAIFKSLREHLLS
jgi:Family of unknown function (DUF5343)